MYVECSFVELYAGQAMADEVIAWLRKRGFMLRGVHNVDYGCDGSAIQGDFLFARNHLPRHAIVIFARFEKKPDT